MITEMDLQQAILECQGQRNPTANTCIKLAAYLIIQKELYGEKAEQPAVVEHSYLPAPEQIVTASETPFARAIDRQEQKIVLPVLDELMSTLQAIQPRLYNAVMEKLTSRLTTIV